MHLEAPGKKSIEWIMACNMSDPTTPNSKIRIEMESVFALAGSSLGYRNQSSENKSAEPPRLTDANQGIEHIPSQTRLGVWRATSHQARN
jgi:hypothetical protein